MPLASQLGPFARRQSSRRTGRAPQFPQRSGSLACIRASCILHFFRLVYWKSADPIYFILEGVLQRKLHDPRVGGGIDLAKRILVQDRAGVSTDQAVGQVERLGAKFHSMGFPDREDSR